MPRCDTIINYSLGPHLPRDHGLSLQRHLHAAPSAAFLARGEGPVVDHSERRKPRQSYRAGTLPDTMLKTPLPISGSLDQRCLAARRSLIFLIPRRKVLFREKRHGPSYVRLVLQLIPNYFAMVRSDICDPTFFPPHFT